jgi:hypothetical protein
VKKVIILQKGNMETLKYRVIINDCPIAVGAENHTNVGCAAASQHETD